MAGSAGRRNILHELNDPGTPGTMYPRVCTGPTVRQPNYNFPLTPTSPDEEIIKLRGRRKQPAFNPEESPIKIGRSPKKTPVKRAATPTKVPLTPTRSSPRKRLNLTPEPLDVDESALAELSLSSRNPKKPKWQNLAEISKVSIDKGLFALSHEQLVMLLTSAVNSAPEFKQMIDCLLPAPDLMPMEQRLFDLKKNIFKAYPRNVFGVEDGSYCYTRVQTHIDTFKKECINQCKTLMQSQHWPSVVEYTLIALSYAKALPNWAAPAHNKTKKSCIKQLLSHMMTSVQKAKFNGSTLQEIIGRLKELNIAEYSESAIQEIQKLC